MQPFPVMWKQSFKPGWMEKCLGLAARLEQPDICGEQSVGDGVRGRKGDWRSHLAHLSAPPHSRRQAHCSFLSQHSVAPRESGAYHLPKFST